MVQSQPRQIVLQDAVLKKTLQKRVGGVAQGVGPDFKPQYCKKKKERKKRESGAVVAHTYDPSYWEAESQRIMIQGQARANSSGDPISKITRAKYTGGRTEA
jgi:hypothetical protein